MNGRMDTAGTAEANALDSLLQARHSCRAFLPRQVPRATIRRMLEIAQRTASWCNAQPWQAIVTSGQETDRFREVYSNAAAQGEPRPDFAFPVAYQGVYLERRRACGWQLYESAGVARGDRGGARRQALLNYTLFGAPHVAIVTTHADLGVYGAIDCGAYVANLMNAATALGLGCIAQAALASHPDVIRAHFGLPANRLVVCGVSFGYADAAHPVNGFRTARAPLDEVVTWVGEKAAG